MSGNIGLFHEQLVSDGKKIWYLEFKSKLLFEVDLTTYEVGVIGQVPGLNCTNDAYRFFVYSDSKLIFLPFNSNVLLVYDLVQKKYVQYEIRIGNDLVDSELNLFGAAVYGDNLIAFGKHPFIFKFNLVTGEYSLNTKCVKKFKLRNESNVWFNKNYCVYGNHLYMLIYRQSIIIDYDFERDDTNIIEFDTDSEVHFSSITFDGEQFWLISDDSGEQVRLFSVNIKKQKGNVIEQLSNVGLSGTQDVPYFIREHKGIIYLIPCNISGFTNACYLNTEKGDLLLEDKIPVYDKIMLNTNFRKLGAFPYIYSDYYSSIVDIGDSLLMIHPWTGRIIEWNINTGNVLVNNLKIDDSVIKKIMEIIKEEWTLIMEGEITLDGYINGVV